MITVPAPEGWVRTTQSDSEVILLASADGTVTAPPALTVNVISAAGGTGTSRT